MDTFAIRLTSGQDLKASLDELVTARGWPAAIVLTCVGSLGEAAIRFADRESPSHLDGPLEIIALTGCLGADGSHLHILVSDKDGATTGGHLKEGATVRTTAEVVLGILPNWDFTREPDPNTGYLELVARPRHDSGSGPTT